MYCSRGNPAMSDHTPSGWRGSGVWVCVQPGSECLDIGGQREWSNLSAVHSEGIGGARCVCGWHAWSHSVQWNDTMALSTHRVKGMRMIEPVQRNSSLYSHAHVLHLREAMGLQILTSLQWLQYIYKGRSYNLAVCSTHGPQSSIAGSILI